MDNHAVKYLISVDSPTLYYYTANQKQVTSMAMLQSTLKYFAAQHINLPTGNFRIKVPWEAADILNVRERNHPMRILIP